VKVEFTGIEGKACSTKTGKQETGAPKCRVEMEGRGPGSGIHTGGGRGGVKPRLQGVPGLGM